ncbi:hypothetical protein [Kamptonema sp. UHCC 0994]|uniref:hypothetical protein n=1 Tax=Kamptonema sp. UHCC 0994 TaxID=3031329 RepID=UPI0023BA167D|nr:hypothetical protein [Kamptonema sp. UHCC 0994]MDF0552402.1 hypothetical protein [Kamptonema sp. UHCC 0994]
MKIWHSMVALSAVLTPFMAEAALSQPLNSEFPRVSNPEVYVPICYIETTNGTTLDLRKLCGSNSTSTRTTPANNNGNNPANKTNPINAGTNPTNDPNTRERISLPTTNNEGRNTGGNPGTGNMGNPTSGNPNGSQSPSNGNNTNDSLDFPDNTGINLPRVPSSAFGPGGTAPTRDSINGPQNQQ